MDMRHIPKKIREIVKNKQIGLSLPNSLKDKWNNVYVGVKESGCFLILESGTYQNLKDKYTPQAFDDKELNSFETKEVINI